MAKIIGTLGDDTLNGTSKNDYIKGLRGNDALYGGQGNDVIFGGHEDYYDDMFYVETYSDEDWARFRDNDTIYGGNGNDDISDNAGTNLIHAGARNDHVSSRRFDYARLDAHTLEISPIPLLNTIDLGSGNDSAEILLSQGDTLVLDGGTGIDFAHLDFSRLTTADVTFTLSAAVKLVDASVTLRHIEAVHITGNSGNNSFTGGDLDDIFQGGEGNDFIVGGPVPPLDMDVFHTEEFFGEYSDEDWEKYEDDDIIYGGAGNDRIEDYLGANLIDAGAGDDVVTASHFMYTPAWQDP